MLEGRINAAYVGGQRGRSSVEGYRRNGQGELTVSSIEIEREVRLVREGVRPMF
jgi:hypothetical protein